MRLCVIFLLCTATAAFPQSARETAFHELRDDARTASLVDQAATDIKAHRYEAALKKADEAIALKPNDVYVMNARGAALTELKRFDEAEKVLQAAAAIDPKAFPPQFNLGEVLSLQKKYGAAATVFVDLQNRFGPTALLKYKTYLSYALDGRKDQAKEALQLMSYPSDGAAWYYAYAADKLLAGKRGEAKRLLAAAHAIHPDDVDTYADTLRDTGLLK